MLVFENCRTEFSPAQLGEFKNFQIEFHQTRLGDAKTFRLNSIKLGLFDQFQKVFEFLSFQTRIGCLN